MIILLYRLVSILYGKFRSDRSAMIFSQTDVFMGGRISRLRRVSCGVSRPCFWKHLQRVPAFCIENNLHRNLIHALKPVPVKFRLPPSFRRDLNLTMPSESPDFISAHARVCGLCDHFDARRAEIMAPGYKEDAARNEFITPFFEALGWDVAQRVAEAHPGLLIEQWETPFAASLASCRLFVCDHLSTTFAEALALEKPTVLFWDHADTRVRAEAAATFDELRAAGILFDEPRDAAAAVEAAYPDVASWWAAPARVAAVARFRERYARTDPNALDLWARELARVIAAAPQR